MSKERLSVRCDRGRCIHNINRFCGYNNPIDIGENGCQTYCDRSHEDNAIGQLKSLCVKLEIYRQDAMYPQMERCANNISSIARQIQIGREKEPKGDSGG